MKRVLRASGTALATLALSTTAFAAESPETRSTQIMEQVLKTTEPGCAAAVARDGNVIWSGSRGLSNIATGAPITSETVFDIGSTSKQFTATAVLLLVQQGKVSLSHPVSRYVDGMPAWGRKITVSQLIHHTSGIPDYIELLKRAGYTDNTATTQRQALRTLGGAKRLDFTPGSRWEYSNSNYLLLGEVVASAAKRPLSAFLTATIFRPTKRFMVMDPTAQLPNKATSYIRPKKDGTLRVADSKWEQVGDGAIQTTPIDLVKWADNYRTGRIGGRKLLRAQLAGAVKFDAGRYGAGIFIRKDGSLHHGGSWAGFLTAFEVSADRHTAIAVTCNSVDYNFADNVSAAPSERIPRELQAIWFTK